MGRELKYCTACGGKLESYFTDPNNEISPLQTINHLGKYIQRIPLGVDMNLHGLDVHVAGGHINNHAKRVRCEVDSQTELELHMSNRSGERTWIEYRYYSPTQAKTRESAKCPKKYEAIGERLEHIFEEIFHRQPMSDMLSLEDIQRGGEGEVDIIRLWQEREIRKMQAESNKESKLYEVHYELPPLPSLRTVRIITDSEHDAIMTVMNNNPDRIIKDVIVVD